MRRQAGDVSWRCSVSVMELMNWCPSDAAVIPDALSPCGDLLYSHGLNPSP